MINKNKPENRQFEKEYKIRKIEVLDLKYVYK